MTYDALATGLAQFNRREFYECHETLEDAWREASGFERELYQGVLQVGVGFYHLLRRNPRGALALLRRGVEHLAPLPTSFMSVEVARLIAETEPWIAQLEGLPPGRTLHVDPDQLPQVHSSRIETDS